MATNIDGSSPIRIPTVLDPVLVDRRIAWLEAHADDRHADPDELEVLSLFRADQWDCWTPGVLFIEAGLLGTVDERELYAEFEGHEYHVRGLACVLPASRRAMQ